MSKRQTITFCDATVSETLWDEQVRAFFGGPVPYEAGLKTAVHWRSRRQLGFDVKRFYDDARDKVIAATFAPETDHQADSALEPAGFLLRWSETALVSYDGGRVLVFSREEREVREILIQLRKKYWLPWPSIEGPPLVRLMHDGGELLDSPIELTGPACESEEEIGLLYGDGMVAWHRGLVGILHARRGGLVVMRGDPGTGKTSYLRTLVRGHHETVRFHYLSVWDGWLLNDDKLTRYLQTKRDRCPGKAMAIFIEDAEELLRPRDNDDRQALVSCLLNATDGIRQDELAVTIICTANCPLKAMDPAVSRPGRLMASREFTALNRKQAQRIATYYGLPAPEADSITLAELFNARADLTTVRPRRTIGFAGITT